MSMHVQYNTKIWGYSNWYSSSLLTAISPVAYHYTV